MPVRLDPFQNIVGVSWVGGPDIVFLVDSTASMPNDIMSQSVVPWAQNVLDEFPGSRVGYANFRDFPFAPYGEPNDYIYLRRQWLLGSGAVFFPNWTIVPDGGGDIEEAHYDALLRCTTDQAMGWNRPKKIIVLVGDTIPHNYPLADPSKPHISLDDAVLALRAARTFVVWCDILAFSAPFLGGFGVNASNDWESVRAGIQAGLEFEEW